jgi:hypothetical protein
VEEAAVTSTVAIGGTIVNVSFATGLGESFVAVAIDSRVSESETVSGPLYRAELVVGVVPFVV